MFTASNVHFEMAERTRAISCAGIGAVHSLARRLGLVEAIDQELNILKVHRPYLDSDHILNMAFNLLAGGRCLEDLELLRNDENYMNALGAQRIPDPTTAGDFCRRFGIEHIRILLDIINRIRLRVWHQQPPEFFEEAILDVDASVVTTLGECKEGADFSYDGKFGYLCLVISLANTGEILHLSIRGANRPSHDGAAQAIDEIVQFCKDAGFREVTVRGDTDYSLTHSFDPWNVDRRFVVGFDSIQKAVGIAQELPSGAWRQLERREKKPIKTEPREKPANVREQVVWERGYKNLKLVREDIAEFPYRPNACKRTYRMVVIRKTIVVEQNQGILEGAEQRFHFYITNDWIAPPESVVFDANDRCNQENLFSQLSEAGVLYAPLGDLLSNWAYMTITSLAWSFQKWFALLLPEGGRWSDRRKAEKQRAIKMKFRTFLHSFMLAPAQIARSARRITFRFLNWNPWRTVFFRGWEQIQQLRC